MLGLASLIQSSFRWTFSFPCSYFVFGKVLGETAINKSVWPCQREKEYCISNQLKCVGWAAEHELSRSPAFVSLRRYSELWRRGYFKMNARRNFSEMVFRSGSQPLKSFRPDGVRLEYYRTPCHWCKIPPPGFAFFSIFLLHHRGFVRGFALAAVVFSRVIGPLFLFLFSCSPGSSLACSSSVDPCPYTYR